MGACAHVYIYMCKLSCGYLSKIFVCQRIAVGYYHTCLCYVVFGFSESITE